MDFKRIIIPLMVAITIAAIPFSCAGAAGDDTPEASVSISDISVNLRISGRLPASLKDRISESVLKVGEKALLGKTLREAGTLEASLSQVMKKIFSEVLSGFEVLDLKINLGTSTQIDVYLKCSAPGIETVTMQVIPQEGIHPRWKVVFEEKLADMAADLEAEMAGVPVESTSWSAPLLEQIVREKAASIKGFTGFQLDTSIETGSELVLRVDVKPVAPTIRRAAVKMRSASVPSLALERIKFDLAQHTDFLLGVPIDFAAEHEDFIVAEYRKLLATNDFANNLKLKYEFRTLFQSHTLVSVVAESEKYRGFARVKVSLGKSDRNPDTEGHLGIFLLKDTEVFTEFNFLPGPIDLQFNLGVSRRLGNFDIAVGRNVIDGLDRIWMNANLTEDIIVSWEKNVTDRDNGETEGSITFRAHDFFSIEMVSDFHTDFWLRFTANL